MKRDSCVHEWMIDTPDGPLSQGSCRSCGATRDDFMNIMPFDYIQAHGTGRGRKNGDHWRAMRVGYKDGKVVLQRKNGRGTGGTIE